jgi:spermidine/putrescine ABC transporter ATP-binding subunit
MAEERKTIIRFKDVTKRFGQVRAVDNVSLDILEGEFFCLLGPSGCGKTTLMRMLAGFEVPTEGEVLLDGQNVAGEEPNKLPVNMVFQSYAVFPHMSVFDNVAYGLKVTGVAKAEIKARVSEALEMVQLGSFADRMPDQMSGGQRQRVALARALVKRPRVLLLDEPLSALDAKLRDAMRLELVRLQEQVGITFIMVTHDQDEALAMADRIAVMNKGEVIQVATPRDLYEYPNSRFVADFIGSVNLFEGTLQVDKPDEAIVQSAELGGHVWVDHGVSGAELGKVWAALRPEKIHMHKLNARLPTEERLPAGHNRVEGVVQTISYLGDLSLYEIRLDTGKMVRTSLPNLYRHGEEVFTWDERVVLSWTGASPVILLR